MIEQELREWVERYLENKATLEEFEDWFLPATWETSQSDIHASEMASEIRLYLAEFDRGDRSQERLRMALSGLITRPDWRVSTGASATDEVLELSIDSMVQLIPV